MLNADQNELDKFSELAHRWWDKKSEFKPLHEINPLRLEWIDRHAKLSGKTVLDIGCGGGILAESMTERGANVTGIDLSEKALGVARLHLLESGVAVVPATAFGGRDGFRISFAADDAKLTEAVRRIAAAVA